MLLYILWGYKNDQNYRCVVFGRIVKKSPKHHPFTKPLSAPLSAQKILIKLKYTIIKSQIKIPNKWSLLYKISVKNIPSLPPCCSLKEKFLSGSYLPCYKLCWTCFCLSQHFWQEHHARFNLPILVLNSSSLVWAWISLGNVFHIVGAKDRKLLYPKVIWLDFGISKSKGFLYWCCDGLSVISSFKYFGSNPFFILYISVQIFSSLFAYSVRRPKFLSKVK